jgi:hypothetical protein
MPPVNAFEETFLYFKYLGFEIQLKPEQRKYIINLLRGEDAGYRRFFLRNTEKFDLSIIHFKYILNISYSCLVICSL